MSYFKTVELKNLVDAGNSTSTPLGIGGVFTGVWVDTSHYGTATIGIISDKASAVDGLCICYSDDSVNVVQTDVFSILANEGKTFSVGMANRYMRITYTNGTEAQTSFSIQTILKSSYIKPSSHRITDSIVGQDDAELVKSVLTGLNQDGNFVNIEASYANSLLSSLIDQETGRRSEIEPLGSLKVATPVRLVGTTFSNGTKDPNFWTETVTGSGVVTQAGEVVLSTGITADSTAKYTTVRSARKITGTTNQFRAVARNKTAIEADSIRRIGPYTSTDGFFLQFDGLTFGVGSRKNSVDTVVENGNFNGNGGATIDFSSGIEYSRIVIDYTALSAKFFVDGVLIHTIMPTTESLTNTLTLPVTMEIINENGNTTNNEYEVLFATILRLGELKTNATSKYILTGTDVLKYGAGVLRRIIVSDNIGRVIIYDNTAGSGTIITNIDTAQGAEPAGSLEFEVPFNIGLTIVITGNVGVTVVYE